MPHDVALDQESRLYVQNGDRVYVIKDALTDPAMQVELTLGLTGATSLALVE